jgi:Na+-transporting NADH:ubiquinone oxidoreductase subunit NqrB
VKRAVGAVRRAAVGGIAAVPVVVAGASWHALAALLLAMLILVTVVCWIVNDNGRSRRLALLIRAYRHGSRR